MPFAAALSIGWVASVASLSSVAGLMPPLERRVETTRKTRGITSRRRSTGTDGARMGPGWGPDGARMGMIRMGVVVKLRWKPTSTDLVIPYDTLWFLKLLGHPQLGPAKVLTSPATHQRSPKVCQERRQGAAAQHGRAFGTQTWLEHAGTSTIYALVNLHSYGKPPLFIDVYW